jgi:hypothetical protein
METQASVKTKCDGCGATLGNSSYSNKRGSISVTLADGTDDSGYETYGRYDYCGEPCMLKHLQNRSNKSKGMKVSVASVQQHGNVLELDVTKSPSYKKPQAETVAK